MKSLKSRIVAFLVWICNFIWPVWSSIGLIVSSNSLGLRIFQRFLYEVWEEQGVLIEHEARTDFPDLRVANGRFAGMRYPTFEAAGSSLYPKLLGVYESELIEKVEIERLSNVELLVDVGCAEGYYAVGFARLLKNLKVHAYDTSPHARRLCEEMAILNDVSDRVSVMEACLPSDLVSLEGRRAFVVSDCEGYEWELFNSTVIESLAHSDCLIEIHEKDERRCRKFFSMFEQSHELVIVESIPDAYRPGVFTAEIGTERDYSLRLLLAAECRAGKMHWLYAKSKLFKETKCVSDREAISV